MSQSKGSWCLGFTLAVLTAEQQCTSTVRCTFTFLFCWCFLSVWPCHPGSLHISQHVSFITAFFSLSIYFIILCVSCVSWHFLSVSHPLHPQIVLSSFILVQPLILWIAVGVLFRPISPISQCWEGGAMRNELAVIRAAWPGMRYTCVGCDEMDECVL